METRVSRGDIELDHYNDQVGCADPVFQRKVKGITHFAYKNKKELLKRHKNAKISDAGAAQEGDWVEARNGVMSQVLKTGSIGKSQYIRTVLGQFRPYKGNNPISGEPHKNIYTFSKKDPWDYKDREIPTEMEILFVSLIFGNVPKEVAYMHLYKTNNFAYAKERSAWLLKQKRIKKVINEKLADKMDKLNITEDMLLEEMRDSILAENGSVKFNYIKLATEMRGMMPKEKSHTIGLMQKEIRGFTKQELEAFTRPALEEKNDIGKG
jgi:hypothetical protein|tara:strand:- start:307 stop:1107 length:801 start_codon:yes stop_codon:yes gene_type:complete